MFKPLNAVDILFQGWHRTDFKKLTAKFKLQLILNILFKVVQELCLKCVHDVTVTWTRKQHSTSLHPETACFCCLLFFSTYLDIALSNSVNLTLAVKVNQCIVKNQWIRVPLFGRVTSLASQESGTNHAQKWSSPEVVVCYKFWLRARAIVHRAWHFAMIWRPTRSCSWMRLETMDC